MINPWLILVASAVTGGVSLYAIARARIIKSRLDGQTLEEIYSANWAAIRLGRPVPFPSFMPAGSITVTTNVEVQAPAPAAALPKEPTK